MIRLQRSRARGWRMPPGAVYVGRPTIFGNPWTPADARAWGLAASDHQVRAWCVERYRPELDHLGLLGDWGAFASEKAFARMEETMDELDPPESDGWGLIRKRSIRPLFRHLLRDATALVCWCPLCPAHADGLPSGVSCPDCAPCHADVLMELMEAQP